MLTLQCPQPLRTARLDKKLAVFVGAGASIGLGYPDWKTLVQNMVSNADEILDRTKRTLALDACEKADAAQLKVIISVLQDLYYQLEPRSEAQEYYEKCVAGALTQTMPAQGENDAGSKPTLHDSLLKLCPKLIVTTNIDLEFERAIKRAGGNWSSRSVSQFSKEDLESSDFSQVVYLHGRIGEWKDIVLSTDEYYRTYYERSDARSLLRFLFSDFSVLFIGFGMGDEQILEELHRTRPREDQARYALLATGHHLYDLFCVLDVEVLAYKCEGNQHEGLQATVERWASPMPVVDNDE